MTQDELVLARLQEGRTITPVEAADDWGILALHSAVARLRKRGYIIQCDIRTGNGRRWGEYKLVPHKSAVEGIERVETAWWRNTEFQA